MHRKLSAATAAVALACSAVATLLAACGPKSVFNLSAKDNDPPALARALALRTLPSQPGPLNSRHTPLVFAVATGSPRQLIAFDLAAGKPLWSIDADIESRVVVAGDLVVAREGKGVTVRNLSDGGVRAQIAIPGDLVGATTDGDQVYAVWAGQHGTTPEWTIAAFTPDGAMRWHDESPGALGAPAAQGGLVLLPFLKQWLSILDAKHGNQLTRIRGVDEEIGMLRVTSDAAFFGSGSGVFRLDERAAAGTRAGGTYGHAVLPPELASADYGRDVFDPVQDGYSAFDRKRVLWRAQPGGDGPMRFTDDIVGVHFFRFIFGLGTDGSLKWAYSQPRVELVASEHAGTVLVGVAADGAVVALDPPTGAVRAQLSIQAKAPLIGATFDCDGWAPTGSGEAPATLQALVAIARDRDARFEGIKQYAVASLAKLEGPDVTRDLLAIVQDPRTPAKLSETVVNLVIARKDPQGLPALLAALAPQRDYIEGTGPIAVSVVARALGALGDRDLSADQRAQAVTALTAQLDDPATPPGDRLELVKAMIAIGKGGERPRLRRELVTYRADPELGVDTELIATLCQALAAGDQQDRETLRMIAEDPRSIPQVATAAKAALGK
ncbi:MAG TPA: PQQ-binding-like beta-propeller repeat protein [Kofleriaceae bacterium]|nr:PQQ-binding-like beta-propeller repeat protein [Kofleriaceae bacterium]